NGETVTFDRGQIHAIQVNTQTGTNAVAVRSTPRGVNVSIDGGSNSNDTVTVGKNGSLAGIASTVNVANNSGHTALVVDDSTDTVARTAAVTSDSVTGLSAGAIHYTAASATGTGVTSVAINGGHGANTFNVLSTAALAPLSIGGGVNSHDVVRIGS